MPAYKEHVYGGLVAYIFLVSIILHKTSMNFPQSRLSEWLLCTLIGSLFPDIDIKSKGQRLVYSLLLLYSVTLILLGKVEYAAYSATFFLVPVIARHRGICHELWFAVLIALCIMTIVCYHAPHHLVRSCYDLLFFLGGVISHLILDKRIRLPFKR